MKLLTLKDVAPMLNWSIGHCRNRLGAGTFPIRRVADIFSVRFLERDVIAFVERGEITEPKLLARKRRTRLFLQSAKKSA